MTLIDIDVLVCTYKRASLVETLRSIDDQQTPDNIALRIIVADNDTQPSAATLVNDLAATMSTPMTYLHAPARNISIARNACLDHARGDWLAFIDDDEIAAPGWICGLLDAARKGGYDGVFGPVLARYDTNTPCWISERDYLSTRPVTRGGEIQTGYTGNALLRWRGARYQGERFRLDKGRSGGEDTEFFFRLWRAGARFDLADDAIIYEAVEPVRLTFDWIRKRKFRAGQSYGRHSAAPSEFGALALLAGSLAKIAGCVAMAALHIFSPAERRFWMLRGVFHCGVLSACVGAKEGVVYGD